MADCLPFNSLEHDRIYKAEDWAWYFATFIGNGVFPRPSDGLQVTAGSDMEINVNEGYAFINGYAFRNPVSRSIALDRAEGAQSRIDRVVVRWDLPQRDIYLAVLKGVPSAKPVAAEVTRSLEIWELALADIYVGKGVTSIRASNITDQRFNSSVCGIVKGTVEEIDASAITKQFDDFLVEYNQKVSEAYEQYTAQMALIKTEAEAEFNAWFGGIKENLSGNVAGNLQNQIDSIRAASVDGLVLKDKENRRYEECRTAAGIQKKTVTIPNMGLRYGTRISVMFIYGNTSIGATLNVNNTGDLKIRYKGKEIDANLIKPNTIVDLVYINDGRWHIVGELPQSQIDEILSVLAVSAEEMNIKNGYLWKKAATGASGTEVIERSIPYEGAQSAHIAVTPGGKYKIYTCDAGTGETIIFAAKNTGAGMAEAYVEGEFVRTDVEETGGRDIYTITVPEGYNRLLINSWNTYLQEIKVYKCP